MKITIEFEGTPCPEITRFIELCCDQNYALTREDGIEVPIFNGFVKIDSAIFGPQSDMEHVAGKPFRAELLVEDGTVLLNHKWKPKIK